MKILCLSFMRGGNTSNTGREGSSVVRTDNIGDVWVVMALDHVPPRDIIHVPHDPCLPAHSPCPALHAIRRGGGASSVGCRQGSQEPRGEASAGRTGIGPLSKIAWLGH